jgi:hypothetical protein
MVEIEFKEIDIKDPVSNDKIGDGVVVIRNGEHIASLPEYDRLEKALSLSLAETEEIRDNLRSILGREPSEDEKEFWEAIAEYKQTRNDF